MANYNHIDTKEIKPTVLGSTKLSATTPVTAPKQPNSINGVEITEGNVDVASIKSTQKPVKQVRNNDDRSLGQIKQSLENTCLKYNINGSKLMLSLSAITGKTLKEFNQMDEQTQKALLSYVEESVNRVGEKAPSNVDRTEAVIVDAAFMYRAVTRNGDGTYSALEDITPEQMAERRENFDKFLKEKFDTEKERISKLPEAEREDAIAQLKSKHAEMRQRIFSHIHKKISPEAALEMMSILAIETLGDGAEEFLNSLSDEEKVKIASDIHSFEQFEKCLKAAKERGENLNSAEAIASVEKYNTNFVAWKNKEAADSYQDAYREAREKFLNGEGPDYYSEEIFKATAEGIGFGAQINHVMSAEDKADFTSTWEEDAIKFGDNDVIESVNKKVEVYKQEHPQESAKTEKAENSSYVAQKTKTTATISVPLNRQAQNPTYSTTNPIKAGTSKVQTKVPTKTEDIIASIHSGKISMQEACKQSPDAVSAILSDPKLRKEFLSDNNMIAIYKNSIARHIDTYCKKTEDKIALVANNPKTLHIMISCLNEDERKKFADAIIGILSYTTVEANFEKV